MLRNTLQLDMIKSWKHKGLKQYYESGFKAGVTPVHARRLKIILQMLDAADTPQRMDTPGMPFHTLKGKLDGFFSVTVSANWRIIFKFDGEDAILVDYLDYH
jgi:toxin HigB-1